MEPTFSRDDSRKLTSRLIFDCINYVNISISLCLFYIIYHYFINFFIVKRMWIRYMENMSNYFLYL